MLLNAWIPLFTIGSCVRVSAVGLMVSALGIRLKELSKETGHTKRTATIPHKIQESHLGAFLRSMRRRITARTSHPAAILMFSNFKKIFSIPSPHSDSAALSIISLIRSASSDVSLLFFVKAAMKSGREPSNASSTNFRLCME